MRILAQPLAGGAVLLAVVRDLSSMRIVQRERLLDPITRRIRKRMPAPLGLRRERKFLVVVGEGLEAGCIDSECEAAIADAERREWIEGPNDGRVSRDACVTIDDV